MRITLIASESIWAGPMRHCRGHHSRCALDGHPRGMGIGHIMPPIFWAIAAGAPLTCHHPVQ